jgi:hypothetical protein
MISLSWCECQLHQRVKGSQDTGDGIVNALCEPNAQEAQNVLFWVFFGQESVRI